jgi:hypothetical protein
MVRPGKFGPKSRLTRQQGEAAAVNGQKLGPGPRVVKPQQDLTLPDLRPFGGEHGRNAPAIGVAQGRHVWCNLDLP